MEEAFYTTDRVMTCSFHKFGEYFPGTGTQDDLGRDKGKGYAVNVPLKDGITDESFKSVFVPVRCGRVDFGENADKVNNRLLMESWSAIDLLPLYFSVGPTL